MKVTETHWSFLIAISATRDIKLFLRWAEPNNSFRFFLTLAFQMYIKVSYVIDFLVVRLLWVSFETDLYTSPLMPFGYMHKFKLSKLLVIVYFYSGVFFLIQGEPPMIWPNKLNYFPLINCCYFALVGYVCIVHINYIRNVMQFFLSWLAIKKLATCPCILFL